MGLASSGVLLFDGGVISGMPSTSVFQNGEWTRAATTGPPVRNGHAMAYDAVRNVFVLFGGFRTGQNFSDTWEWNGQRWAQMTRQ